MRATQAAESAAADVHEQVLPRRSSEKSNKYNAFAAARLLRGESQATGHRLDSMTQIHGANSAQYSLAWLLSAQQAGAPSASTAFDLSGGMPPPGMVSPDAAAAPPPFSRDAMGALMGAQEQANGPSSSSGQQAVSGTDDAGDPGEIATKPKKRHGHRAPQGLDALLQAMQSTSTNNASETAQAQLQSNRLRLLQLQAKLTTPVTPSATAATV
jgi:hypothetical protein